MKKWVVLPTLVAALGSVLPAAQVSAQTLTFLHSFTGGSDGANPHAGLALAGNTLYGTTTPFAPPFETFILGHVFAINTDGTGFTNLYGLAGGSEASMILSGDTLYGTTPGGGPTDSGTVFAMKTDGTGFTNLYSFTIGSINASRIYTNSDGANPMARLILSGESLYGTASRGGSSGNGAVFKLNIDGTGFTDLHVFDGNDGSGPYAGLVLSGNTLYGTTVQGGNSGQGTVFALSTNGTGFTALHSFTAPLGSSLTNSDGTIPYGGLVLSGNRLYGTTESGGASAQGTVFALNTDGTGFETMYNFGGNSDGAAPLSSLILSGDTLYGTAAGGSGGKGTVFAMRTDGTGFTTLYSFYSFSGLYGVGPSPNKGLVLSGNTLYGTASAGIQGILGLTYFGAVFSISFPPQLSNFFSGSHLVLSWPTNYAGFDYTGYTLQSTTNLVSPVWTTVSPTAVVVNGQNIVTNPISGEQQFFRLIR